MSRIKILPAWDICENDATPEEVYLNRRKFLGNMGRFGVNALALYMLPNFLALNTVFGANSTSANLTSQAGSNFMDLYYPRFSKIQYGITVNQSSDFDGMPSAFT